MVGKSNFFGVLSVSLLALVASAVTASSAQLEQAADRENLSLSLNRAAAQGRAALMSQLLCDGADPNGGDPWLGRRPLHFAVSAPVGVDAIIALLVLAGANLNQQEITGRTPLHLAVTQGNDTAVRALLGMGANVNTVSRQGTTPLIDAVRMGNIMLVDALINAGANTNIADENAKTPLHYAAEQGNTDLVTKLLNANAQVNAQDRSGKTPLDLADPSNYEIIRALISRGARVRPEGRRAMRGRAYVY